jgi:hypothetical protein
VNFVMLKNGSSAAHLEPGSEKTCSGKELAETLARIKLSKKDAAAWNRDLKKARKSLKSPRRIKMPHPTASK